MEFYLHQRKITSDNEFNPKDEWLQFPVKVRTSMWFAHGEIPFFANHIEELNNLIESLRLKYRIETDDHSELLRLAIRLINKNKAFMGGWLHLHFFINDSTWNFIGQIEKYPHREIPFDENGKLAIISDEVIWSQSVSFSKKYLRESIWMNEKLKITGTRYGDSVFCNEKGAVVETIGSNLFCVSQDKFITPSLGSGCTNNNLRALTIESASLSGLIIIESDALYPDDLQQMDEIFTASEQNGFKWIMGVGTKRFVKKKTEIIRNGVDKLVWQNRKNLVDYR